MVEFGVKDVNGGYTVYLVESMVYDKRIGRVTRHRGTWKATPYPLTRENPECVGFKTRKEAGEHLASLVLR